MLFALYASITRPITIVSFHYISLTNVIYRDLVSCFQWFSVKRQHALLILADNLYYTKFKHYCRVSSETNDDSHFPLTLCLHHCKVNLNSVPMLVNKHANALYLSVVLKNYMLEN